MEKKSQYNQHKIEENNRNDQGVTAEQEDKPPVELKKNHKKFLIIPVVLIFVIVISITIFFIINNSTTKVDENTSKLTLSEPIGFYYLKETGASSLDEDTEGILEVVVYNPISFPATSTLLHFQDTEIDSIFVGRNGTDSILIPDNGTIFILSATSSEHATFTYLRKKDPPQLAAMNPFLLPNEYHRIVYMAYIDNWLLYQYDFPSSTGRVVTNDLWHEVGGIPILSKVRPVYLNESTNTLWLVNEGDSFSSVFTYSYETEEFTKVSCFN